MRKTAAILLFILFIIGPLSIALSGKINFNGDWRTADRSSAHIAPNPLTYRPAIVQVYAARAFGWRGIFAVHTWIAVKAKNAKQYQVYQVLGWRTYQGLPTVMHESDIPDRIWFANRPQLIQDIRGEKAGILINKIKSVVNNYPYKNRYELWPGPNSNSFTAFIARKVPGLCLAMPSTAIGKDYLGDDSFFAKAPSCTGYQFSFFGMFGILAAVKEGIEINILGLVFGFNPFTSTLTLPGVGLLQIYWNNTIMLAI